MSNQIEPIKSRKVVGDLLKQIADGSVLVRVQPGETWQLGRHRLCCGSSLDESVIKGLLLGAGQPGLIWSDPPYGIKIQNKDGRIGGGSKGKVSTFSRGRPVDAEARAYPIIAGDDTTDTAIAAFRLCQRLFPKAAQIWWGANHYSHGLPFSRCWIVWDKLNGATSFADCELAWTNQKTAVRKFAWRWNGMVKQGMAANERRMHPNQKPVELVEWFWRKYAKTGPLCFDPFLGSGTSIIAAERLSDEHTVYGCELMPEYCEVILQRWEAFTGSKAVLARK